MTVRFFLPEWTKQWGTLLTWPHESGDFSHWLDAIEDTYVKLVGAIQPRQHVLVLCQDPQHHSHIEKKLAAARVSLKAVRFFQIPYNDLWIRDYGPLHVLENGRLKLLNFRFNGWGGKYEHALDDAATDALIAQNAFSELQAEVESADFVLEGGALETDGLGTLLCTERCVLAETRNPGMRRVQMEEMLRNRLGVERILWLKNGYLEGDDTDGHIDMLVRFTDPHTLCYVSCQDKTDPHYEALQALLLELQALRNFQGEPYKLVPLPWPTPKFSARTQRRLPASYANFLIINQVVIVPVYDDPADQVALEQLQHCFPHRYLIPIDASVLIEQFGSIHCATMQLPAFSTHANF